jgi:hypothetical protein
LPRFILLLPTLLLLLWCVAGCTVVYRHPPMSVERGQASVVASLARSEVISEWLADRPQVSLLPMKTPDGLRSAVGDPVLSAIEHWLVANRATVVARDRQDQMICEIERQSGNAFDPRFRAQLGRQLGSKWFVTGTVTPVERYWNFHSREGGWVDRSTIVVSIIEAETGRVLWEDHLPLVAHSTDADGIVPSGSECHAPPLPPRPPTWVKIPVEPSEPFAAVEASRALDTAAADASLCGAVAEVPLVSTARVTFANDGSVAKVELDSIFARTPTEECVKKRFGAVRVPAFYGRQPTMFQRFEMTRRISRPIARNP